MLSMPKNVYRHDDGAGSKWVKDVGNRLRWVRELVADNQTQAAKMVGCDQSTFSGYENGDRLISMRVAMLACQKWGITLDYLYRGRLTSEVRQDVALRLAAAHRELVADLPPLERGPRAKEAAQVT